MAEVGAVKVERSRARGHVASNTLTAPAGAIPLPVVDLFWVLNTAHPNSKTTKALLVTVRFFEASAATSGSAIKNQNSKIKNDGGGEGSRVRASGSGNLQPSTFNPQLRLGFDVAASGQGDLAVIYIDELRGESELWLRALFSARTEDWHFLKTALFCFMKDCRRIKGAGDESGLGRQICWEAASQFSGRFLKVNFSSSKNDLAFALMNQLSVSEKRFPRAHQDIAADYFALRKLHNGSRWVFNEAPNLLNPVSHCDIAWAGALATHAHTEQQVFAGAWVVY